MRATARTLLAALTVALAAGTGCFVSHEARRAPLGYPAAPATRTARVTMGDFVIYTGDVHLDDLGWRHAVVTKEGTMYHHPRESDGKWTVLIGVHVAGGAPGAARQVEVLDMMWSPPSAPRCQGGHPALDVLMDFDGEADHSIVVPGQVHWERPILVRGARVVAGRFDEDQALLMQPSVVDVRVVEREGAAARETCVRVPVTGPDVTYWSTKRWSVGARVEWRRALASTPGSVLMLGLSLGRWVGPVRVGLGVLGGGTSDQPFDPEQVHTSTCFAGPGPDCDGVDVGGFSLETGGMAWRWTRWALGWSLTGEALFARMRRYDPAGGPAMDRRASSGGARLGVQLLRVNPGIFGTSPISPNSAWGIELFGAAAHTWSGAASGPPVTFGVALLAF